MFVEEPVEEQYGPMFTPPSERNYMLSESLGRYLASKNIDTGKFKDEIVKNITHLMNSGYVSVSPLVSLFDNGGHRHILYIDFVASLNYRLAHTARADEIRENEIKVEMLPYNPGLENSLANLYHNVGLFSLWFNDFHRNDVDEFHSTENGVLRDGVYLEIVPTLPSSAGKVVGETEKLDYWHKKVKRAIEKQTS